MPVFFDRERPGVFYVHVPKTGGTHVERLFEANGYQMTLWATRPWATGLVCSPQHFHRALWEPFADPAGFGVSFITVRHPVDRLLSKYRDVRQVQGADIELEPWLRDTEVELARDPYVQDNHLRPQWEFHHPALVVFRQEDGLGPEWARALSDAHGLGFTVFDVESRRPPRSAGGPVTTTEQQALLSFCDRFYGRDFATFGYRPDAARAFAG